METTFGDAISGPKRVPLSGGLLGSGRRPPSLLQRGKSFTSDDLLDPEPAAESGQDHRAELESYSMITAARGSGSPMSSITNSPPSSEDSHAQLREAEMEVVVEPYTPTEQSFPRGVHELDAMHASSTTPTGRKSGRVSPSGSDVAQMGDTPKNTSGSREVPWTAPVLGRSDASSTRRSNDEMPLFAEEDRYLKRQRTRSNPREERAGSEGREQ